MAIGTPINSPLIDKSIDNNSHINSLYSKFLFLITITFLFLLTSNAKLYSQASAGGFSEAYLFRNTGARVASLAGAFTAISNDPNTVFLNPAGIGFLSNKSIFAGSVSSIGLGRTHSSAAWAQRIHPNFGLGIGFNSLNSGSFEARDLLGNPQGRLTDWQYSLSLSGSYRMEMVSVGATVRYLKHALLGSNIYSNGVSVDLGTKFDVLNMFTFGLSIQNLGSQVLWNQYSPGITEENEALPYVIRAGIAMEFGLNDELVTQRSKKTGKLETIYLPPTQYILLDVDAVMYEFDNSPRLLIGAEAVLDERFVLRAGFSIFGENNGKEVFFPSNNWGSGVSIRPNLEVLPFYLIIDYSVGQEYISNTGVSHNIGFVIEL